MKTFAIEAKESACFHSLFLSLHIWYSPSRMHYVSRLLANSPWQILITMMKRQKLMKAEITMSNSKRTLCFTLFIETLPTVTGNTTTFNCREYVCVRALIHRVPNLSLYLKYNTFFVLQFMTKFTNLDTTFKPTAMFY